MFLYSLFVNLDYIQIIFKENATMETNTKSPQKNMPLNNLQIGLLKLFQREVSESDILSLNRVLVAHYDTLLRAELEQVIEKKQYTQTDFDDIINGNTTK